MHDDIFVLLLGISSAVIDNVPLVAASMGMFNAPVDDHIWQFIAFSAGTGGSMLIIGSAAGVVAMGMEKISFFWYLKNMSDRKSTRLNSSHVRISYAVFCLKKKINQAA